jgi:HAMP domain-containing protein
MDVIVAETKVHASSKLNQSWKQLVVHCIGSAGSLLAIILIMFYINAKVIVPIGRLTSTLNKLAIKQLDVELPLLNQKNEIGEMARALAVFRETSVRLDEDNRLLQIAEEKIRMSEEKLKLILNSIPDMIIEVNPELKILWANKAALDINPKAIGQACYSAFPGKNTICDGCYCKKTFETGKIERGVMYQPASKTAGESYWENIGIPLNDSKSENLTVLEVSRNVTERIKAEAEKEKLIKELQQALSEVRTLTGLLPICSHCKKIRDDKGYWNSIESYIHEHSEAEFSHSICRECAEKLYPDMDLYGDDPEKS